MKAFDHFLAIGYECFILNVTFVSQVMALVPKGDGVESLLRLITHIFRYNREFLGLIFCSAMGSADDYRNDTQVTKLWLEFDNKCLLLEY